MQIITPNRVSHRYTQSLCAPPAKVFPLLCPVQETHWAPGWAPLRVISETGLMEPHCLFTTPESDGANAIWINTNHDAEALSLTLWKVVPEQSVCRLDIDLSAAPGGGSTADISYSCTSLGSAGDAFLQQLTTDWYEAYMQHWQDALNHYLVNGAMIQMPPV